MNIITHRYNDLTFYEVRNVLDNPQVDAMKGTIDFEIENFLAIDVPRYQTQNYLHKRYRHATGWKDLFDSCEKIVKQIFPNKNYCLPETKGYFGCWANVSKPDSTNFIFHQHESHVQFSIVYYLSNPSEVYGTMFQDGDCEIIVGGKENSLILFDSRNIMHKTLSPPPQVSKDNFRYSIALDYIEGNSMSYKYN